MSSFSNNQYRLGHSLVRAGVAFALLYPSIAAFSDPIAWAGYFPAFVHQLPVDINLLLYAFGALEIVLALWLLSGRSIRFPAFLSALIILVIVLMNANDFGVLFRDVSIAFAALALCFLPTPGKTNSHEPA